MAVVDVNLFCGARHGVRLAGVSQVLRKGLRTALEHLEVFGVTTAP